MGGQERGKVRASGLPSISCWKKRVVSSRRIRNSKKIKKNVSPGAALFRVCERHGRPTIRGGGGAAEAEEDGFTENRNRRNTIVIIIVMISGM